MLVIECRKSSKYLGNLGRVECVGLGAELACVPTHWHVKCLPCLACLEYLGTGGRQMTRFALPRPSGCHAVTLPHLSTQALQVCPLPACPPVNLSTLAGKYIVYAQLNTNKVPQKEKSPISLTALSLYALPLVLDHDHFYYGTPFQTLPLNITTHADNRDGIHGTIHHSSSPRTRAFAYLGRSYLLGKDSTPRCVSTPNISAPSGQCESSSPHSTRSQTERPQQSPQAQASIRETTPQPGPASRSWQWPDI